MLETSSEQLVALAFLFSTMLFRYLKQNVFIRFHKELLIIITN